MKSLIVFLVVLISGHLIEARLAVSGKDLVNNGEKVYLSGVNIAWINYAWDFGSGLYEGVRSQYEKAIDEVAQNGGNTIRVWVHTDGTHSPKWQSGFATGEDTQSLIDELKQLAQYAANKNIFVIYALFNMAVRPSEDVLNLFWDDSKLNSYVNKVLKPLAQNLGGQTNIIWEIMNEPVGSLIEGTKNSNPCFDTTHMSNTGANWAGCNLKIEQILKFANVLTDAIKSVSGESLVTVGESGEHTMTDGCSSCRNHYTDSCLRQAGGKWSGTLDFYELHSYVNTNDGKYAESAPFHHDIDFYNLDKPLVIGEFATSCSENSDPTVNYQKYYNNGYNGALSWQYNEGGECADTKSSANQGMSSIRHGTNNGKVEIKSVW